MQFVTVAKQKWRACYVSVEDTRECNRAVGYGVLSESHTRTESQARLPQAHQTKSVRRLAVVRALLLHNDLISRFYSGSFSGVVVESVTACLVLPAAFLAVAAVLSAAVFA